ncbi:cation:proton antiporter [Patescibacteria group bacterium]|nr:cation:proton antiporter [Patescibacteria group bacterium]
MQKIKTILLVAIEVVVASATLHYLREALMHSHHHEINTVLPILLDIAFLAVFASFGGRLARVFGIAPMAGKIVMGIIAGPALIGVIDPYASGVEIARLAGVLFILFEAGLHFDLELLKKNIGIATAVAVGGVLIPLVSFTALGHYTIGLDWLPAIFLGGIFTATSVGLSVEALKAAGKLATNMGNRIVGAAVIDDILGVLILTILAKLSQGDLETMNLVWLGVAVIGFFGGVYLMWSMGLADKIAKYLDRHYSNTTGPYTRFFFGSLILGGTIAAVVGLEPVLGAFGIGVVLSKVDNEIKHETWEKIEGYIHIFVGGFLVSIGTMLSREAIMNPKAWVWAIVFTILALIGKYLVKYLFKDRYEGHQVGLAMAIRGEVGLVFVAVAISNHVLDDTMAAAALLAVILVTVVGAIMFEKAVMKETGVKPEPLGEAI